jgi:hypothetical protein
MVRAGNDVDDAIDIDDAASDTKYQDVDDDLDVAVKIDDSDEGSVPDLDESATVAAKHLSKKKMPPGQLGSVPPKHFGAGKLGAHCPPKKPTYAWRGTSSLSWKRLSTYRWTHGTPSKPPFVVHLRFPVRISLTLSLLSTPSLLVLGTCPLPHKLNRLW